MQSSHATLILVITALSVDQVSYANALALVIGANVGTTITAIMGALTSNTNGKRLALSDVLFKVAAGIVFIILMNPIMELVNSIAIIIGLEETDYTLKLAIFHTIFNVSGVILMVPLINPLVRLVSNIIPEKVMPTAAPIFLNDSALELPDTSIEAVRKESIHLYDNAFSIIAHGLSLHRHDILSDNDLDVIIESNRKVIDIDIDEQYNINIKYLYISVPTFSFSTFLESFSQDIFSRQLSGGHTHLYTEDSIKYFVSEYKFEILSEWWFGTDILDLYRHFIVTFKEFGYSEALVDNFKTSFKPLIDNLQLEIDKQKKSSEVHLLLKV